MEFRSATWARVRCLFESPIMDQRKFAKVPTIPADAFILDLEDAVPLADKEVARKKVVAQLQDPSHFPDGAILVPRANGLDSPWGRDDLTAFGEAGATTVMYPKIDSLAELEEVVAILEKTGSSPEIVASIESMAGVINAAEIFSHPSVVVTTFGPGDLHVDASIPMFEPDGSWNPAITWSKVQTVFAAKSQGVAVLSIAFPKNMKDLDETRALIEEDKRLGFTGYCSFYPPQVPIINDLFTPSADEIADAREIVEVYETAVAAGNPAVQLPNGKAVLVHQYKDAQQLLQRAEAFASA